MAKRDAGSPRAIVPAADGATVAAALAALDTRLRVVEERLGRLDPPPATKLSEAVTVTSGPAPEGGSFAGLAGRTLIALGGGYLLRAATEAGVVPGPVGTLLGLAYAAAWIFAGEREFAAGRRVTGLLDGATAVLVAYPLLWESVTRFGGLSTRAAFAVAVALAVAGGALALRRDQPALAWAHALAAGALGLALLVASHDLLAAVVALGALHAAAESGPARRRAAGVRWATAPPLDLALLATVYVAGRAGPLPPTYPQFVPALGGLVVLGICLGLLLHVGRRSWTRPLDPFDVAHSGIVFALAAGAVARLLPSAAGACGVLALGVAIAVDVAVIRRVFPASNGPALAVAASVLTVAATWALLGPDLRVVAWSLAGVAAAARGRTTRAHRFTAGAFVAAALAASGAATVMTALLARNMPVDPGLAAVGAMVAAVLAWWLQPGLATATMGTGAAVLLVLAALPRQGAVAAAAGTMAISVVAVALLVAGRRTGRRDLGAAAAVLLWAGAARVALVDMPGGRPAPLFLSLVSYGVALRCAQAPPPPRP